MLHGFSGNRRGLEAVTVMAVIYSGLCQSYSTTPKESVKWK